MFGGNARVLSQAETEAQTIFELEDALQLITSLPFTAEFYSQLCEDFLKRLQARVLAKSQR